MPTITAVPEVADVTVAGETVIGFLSGGSPVADASPTGYAPRVVCSIAPDVAEISLSAYAVTAFSSANIVPGVAEISFAAFRPSTTPGNLYGRRHTGVDQQPGGDLYPFATPVSSDLTNLIADFYLSYQDLGCSYSLPFSVAWLYGFGDNPTGPTDGYPTPTHAFDILIVDADDTTVFDSTQSGTACYTKYWGGWLQIVEWQSPSQVCRITYFTAWGVNDTPRLYDLFIAPSSAVLDARTCEQLPLRLTSLQYGVDVFQGPVQLVGGYNTTIDTTPVVAADGKATGGTLQIAVVPGNGSGRYDGCTDQQPGIQRVNNQAPDSAGNLLLDTIGNVATSTVSCYRLERPSTLSDGVATFTAATLQLFNDCGACCDCQDFLDTYAAIQKLWNHYYTLGQTAMTARDNLLTVISNYEATQNLCPTNLRIGLAAVAGGIVSVQTKFCNTTNTAILGDLLEINISDDASTDYIDEIGLIVGQTFATGNGEAPAQGFGNTILGGTYPNYTFTAGKIAPGANLTLTFQLIYPVRYFPDPINVAIRVIFLGDATYAHITTIPTLEVS